MGGPSLPASDDPHGQQAVKRQRPASPPPVQLTLPAHYALQRSGTAGGVPLTSGVLIASAGPAGSSAPAHRPVPVTGPTGWMPRPAADVRQSGGTSGIAAIRAAVESACEAAAAEARDLLCCPITHVRSSPVGARPWTPRLLPAEPPDTCTCCETQVQIHGTARGVLFPPPALVVVHIAAKAVNEGFWNLMVCLWRTGAHAGPRARRGRIHMCVCTPCHW